MMDVTSHPGKLLSPNIQRFMEVFSQLEELVQQGKATTLEQVVYLTAEHAVRHATDDQELWWMLAKCQEHVVAFAADARFPPAYYQSYASAGVRYQHLMDTLPPYPRSQGEVPDKREQTGEKKRKVMRRKETTNGNSG